VTELTCDQLDALLPELFDGRLAPEVEAAALQHLATCSECRIVVDDLERVGEMYREHGRLTLPDDARARIRAMLDHG
jgi:predicted anti-sigma-YlaC factor YlaD